MMLNFIVNFGPIAVLVIGALYLSLLIAALYLTLKNERGLMLAFWLIVVFSVPFLGSLLYLAKHLIAAKPEPQA